MDEQRHFSAEEEDALSWILAEKIIRSGFQPDLVLSLYRGGGKVAPTVVEALREIMGWEFDDFPIKARRYNEHNVGEENVILWGVDALPKPPRGRRILLLDDIYDKGHTIRTTKSDVRHRFNPLEVEIFVGTNIWKIGNDPLGEYPNAYARKIPGDVWGVQTYEKESVKASILREKLRADGYTVRDLPRRA